MGKEAKIIMQEARRGIQTEPAVYTSEIDRRLAILSEVESFDLPGKEGRATLLIDRRSWLITLYLRVEAINNGKPKIIMRRAVSGTTEKDAFRNSGLPGLREAYLENQRRVLQESCLSQ